MSEIDKNLDKNIEFTEENIDFKKNNQITVNNNVSNILSNEINISDIVKDLNFFLYEENKSLIIVFEYNSYEIGAIKFKNIDKETILLEKISNINYNTKINEQGIDLGLYDFMNKYLSFDKIGEIKIHGLLKYMYTYFFNFIKVEYNNVHIIKAEVNPSFLESYIYTNDQLKKENIIKDYTIDYGNIISNTYL